MNFLSLSLRRLDDSAELTLALKYDAFEGAGSCFVDIAEFLERARRFAMFPLPDDGSACVQGGYFSEDMRVLKQTHLRILARPLDGLGNLVLDIQVALPVEKGTNAVQGCLTCAIPTTYEKVKELSEAMVALATNCGDEYRIDL
jgi:hypothetical protein